MMAGLGDTLREARLRRGLEISDCESETKIRGKYLRALEEEQFDALPGTTFLRGFLRTYADSLGLDGRAMVAAYTAQHVPVRETTAFEEVLRRGRTKRRSRESRLLAAVTVVALAIATGVWAVFDGPPATANGVTPITAVFAPAGQQPTYVEAREGSITGPLLFTPGNLQPASPITVEVRLPVLIHVGDGSGLALTLDGAPVALPTTSGDYTVTPAKTVLTRTSDQ